MDEDKRGDDMGAARYVSAVMEVERAYLRGLCGVCDFVGDIAIVILFPEFGSLRGLVMFVSLAVFHAWLLGFL